jgi:regulator of sigma E protease
MNIIISILIFSLIIIVHELGHFLLAKKNGIFVTEFSVGMGPRIITILKNGNVYHPKFCMTHNEFEAALVERNFTMYSCKLFPIGGSCIMLGEDDVVEDERAFNRKGVWARISVIFAGPFFNFLFAFLLAFFVIGVAGYDPATVTNVMDNTPVKEAGLQTGDTITNFNGKHIDIGREIDTHLMFYPIGNQEITLTYLHDGKKNKISFTPTKVETFRLGFIYERDAVEAIISQLTEVSPLSNAGIQVGDIITKLNNVTISKRSDLDNYFENHPLTGETLKVTYSRNGKVNTVEVTPIAYTYYEIGFTTNLTRENTNVWGVIKFSIIEVKYWIVTTIQSLKQLIIGKYSMKDMAGPAGIIGMIGDSYKESKKGGVLFIILNMVNMIILLSANLGVMNLLPIPALDGGRLVFLLLELFRGKPIDQKKEGLVHMIGFVALMILMIFVMFNDISRLL